MPDRTLHLLVEVQVRRTPDRVAVICGHDTLSYAELDGRANGLARVLRRHGAGPDTLVGVCLERSLDTPVALLAVLKAGAAYVPVDPSYPQDRIAYMLGDAAAPVLLTQSRLRASLPATDAVLIDLDAFDWTAGDDAPLDGEVSPNQLAYVLYTSGSTGRPKGAEIPHSAICNHMRWMHRVFPLTNEDRVLQRSPISADAAVWEFYAPLMAGAALVMADPGKHLEPGSLARAIQEHRVTTLQVVPALLRMLLDEPAFAESRTLRRQFCGGEALTQDLANRFARTLPWATLINLYGPTEVTIDATYAIAQPGEQTLTVPIGRPVDNTQCYVLDEELQPVASGAAGELYLGGAQVGRGYHGRPDLTAERFIPDRFSSAPGARLYKTGDLCRYLPDGRIEYLGRIDHQVKIRGFRIEIGEVEAVFAAHSSVKDVVVVAREDSPGDKRLVAYVVVRDPAAPDLQPLREHLRAALPDFMVPGAIVTLDVLPLGPNGKIDRAALPRPDAATLRSCAFVAPRTPIETRVAAIWRDVLQVDPIGIHDNFFELGGHSLLAMQVASRVHADFALELSLHTLFDAPTIAELAAHLEPVKSCAEEPIQAADHEGAPLSSAQRRLWFLDRLHPDSPVFNISATLRLAGRLDREALASALDEIVRRHDTLRTTFDDRHGEPRQVVQPASPLDLPIADLRALGPADREATLARELHAEGSRNFDLSRGPLFRCRLWTLDEAEHVLQINVHHIVADGWSMGVLARELETLYAGRAQASSLPALTVRYADVAARERAWLAGEAAAGDLEFWRKHLAGAPALLQLPADRPRPAEQSFRGGVRSRLLPRTLLDALQATSRREKTTMFATLFAAFAVLVHRYTREDDVVVGTPVANRRGVDAEPIVGCFVNMLALRTDLSGQPAFRALLKQVRQAALDGLAHERLPFDTLVEALEPERNAGASPIAQVVFGYQDATASPFRLPGLAVNQIPASTGTSKYDLTLTAECAPDGLRLWAEYSSDLFDAATIDRLLDHYSCLIAGIPDNLDRPIADLPLVPEAERRQLLSWNETGAAPVRRDRTLHEIVEAQAGRTPDRVAVVCGGERWSYRLLNERANQVAHHVRARGARPGVLVGVFLERSADMVAAVLGILKAGAAYVPLDPDYPKARLANIVEDASLELILTQTTLADSLRESRDNPDVSAGPGDLAYVLFTSGSTGRPKGVAIEHHSAVTFVDWALTVFTLDELAGVLFSTSLCFDLSVFELFVTLAAGGTIVVAPNALHLPTLEARETVTLINTVPSAMAELVRVKGVPSSVKTVNLAGEALPDVLVEQIYASTRAGQVYNLYGPTESTTYATYTAVPRNRPVTIGRPIDHTQAYVLDEHMQLVPIGVPGELYLAGEGLARGYYGRPDLTSERFVPNPIPGQPCDRLYRTGDLCRWSSDGTLHYLGRADHQVKIRGFRIEPGEIEAVCHRHPAVRQCLVMAREDAAGDRRLVAYLEPQPGAAAAVDDIRAHLAQHVPAYMVPSMFVVIETWPLTPNGKIDRRALSRLAPVETEKARPFTEPRTTLERRLAAVWSEVLDVERVSVHDDFFALGGHSLLVMQAVSRIRDAFDVDLPPQVFFSNPTIARLAAAWPVAGRAERLPRIERRSNTGPRPLSFGQERLWFLDQLTPGSVVHNVAHVMHFDGPADARVMARALNAIVHRHEALRTSFSSREGRPAQEILPAIDIPLASLDLRALTEKARDREWQRAAGQEARKPFDLARPPLIRATLVSWTRQTSVLLLTFHHIVTDEWSLEVIERELRELYAAFTHGRPSPLAELPIQYADFASWQREWMQGEVQARQLAFWREELAGAPAMLALPATRPRPAVQSFRGTTETFELPKTLLSGLRSLGSLERDEHATPFMTLAAAFTALLHRHAGQDDVLVGTPVSGRSRAETEGLVGFFLNTIVLRARFEAGSTFRSLLRQVRDRALAAYSHQDLPFDQLVAELAPRRDRSSSPIFQVMFVYHEAQSSSPGPAARVAPLPDTGTSKFDLTLALADTANGLQGVVEYSTDLYDAAAIRALIDDYRALLEAFVLDPDERIEAARLGAQVQPRAASVAPPVDRPSSRRQFRVVPRTSTEQRLAAIWREVLDAPHVGSRDDFFELGGHSLLAMRVVHLVDQQMGIALPPGALFEHPVLADLARRIDAIAGSTVAVAAPETKVLWQMAAGGNGLPFFWVHGVTGEVVSYQHVSRHLAQSRPVYGFAADWTDLPSGETLTLEAMAARYVRELRVVQATGPYYLGGFCAGSMIALEMARQLEAAGQTVGLLAAIDYDLSPREMPASRLQTLLAFLRNAPRWFTDDAWPSGARELWTRISTRLSSATRGPDIRDQLGMWRVPDRHVKMLNARYEAICRYKPQPIDGRAILLLPRAAPLFGPWPAGAGPAWNPGWSNVACGGVEVYQVPGSHSTMLSEPFARALALKLNAAIEASEARIPAAPQRARRALGSKGRQ